MAINTPYVPGDPYSYDLKWLTRKVKQADTDAQQALADSATAISTANAASSAATSAVNTANTANTTAGNAVATANAASSQVAHLSAFASVYDWIDTDETTATILDKYACTYGDIFFFRIIFSSNGLGVNKNVVQFKAPYNCFHELSQQVFLMGKSNGANTYFDTVLASAPLTSYKDGNNIRHGGFAIPSSVAPSGLSYFGGFVILKPET